MKAKRILAIVLVIAMLVGMSVVLLSQVNADGETPEGNGVITVNDMIKEGSALSAVSDGKTVYISGIPEKTTAADFMTNIKGTLSIKDKDNAEVDENALLKTGDVLFISDENGAILRAVIVVKGDVNGNGTVNVTDYLQIKRHILRTYELKDAFKNAADVDGDGNVDQTDIISLKNHFIKVFFIGSAFRRIEDEIILPTQPQDPPAFEALNEVIYNEKGTYTAFTDEEFLAKLSAFSNKLYEMSAKDEKGNYSVSPLSAFMALAVLNAIGDDNVKNDIETLFGMTQADIAKAGLLFKHLIYEGEDEAGNVITKLDLTNSIWLDNGLQANKSVLDELAEILYCYAFTAPFSADNALANDAIREFIKEKTKGLIDQDFELTPDTLFAIINTLYFKDIWGEYDLTTSQREFNVNGANEVREFLTALYEKGEVYENDISYSFYAETISGYKMKFVVPKDGYTVKQVMTTENLNEINAVKNYEKDEKADHYTRCIFPSFKLNSDTDLKDIFSKNGYLGHAFSAYTSDLVDEELCVSKIKHTVALNVDKKGIEGAAVTVISNKATSVMPEKPEIYHDFVIDKAFGFVITTRNDIVLFEGQVTDPVGSGANGGQGANDSKIYDFSIRWGTNGQYYYDSKTGALVKTDNTAGRNDTTLILSAEDKKKICSYIDALNIEGFPDLYDPFATELSTQTSDPSVDLVLSTAKKTVKCIGVSSGRISESKKGQRFLNCFYSIVDLICSTEEWNALPE